MLQDIEPHIFDNHYKNAMPEADDYLLCYRPGHVLLRKMGEVYALPKIADWAGSLHQAIHLFALDGYNCFWLPDISDLPGCSWEKTDALRYIDSHEVVFAGITGYHVANWYQSNRFCGKCGTGTLVKEDERALVCPRCGNLIFPKISPAIIVAITCGDKILMARGTHYGGAYFSHLAGYVDVGETLEAAVEREVMEEVGIHVHHITYYKSQPWPFSGSLMIGFFAQADSDEPLRIDENEIMEAGWFDRENLPARSSGLSISADMTNAFLKGTYPKRMSSER